MGGIGDWGLGIGESGLGARASGLGARGSGLGARGCPLSTVHCPLFRLPPSAFPLPPSSNPQSPIPNPSRSGITLLEILWSMAILLGGLLAVAMLIPVGKLAMTAANRSDRTGACGRAALHDLKVRGMLDYTTWYPTVALPPAVAIIDPLYYAANKIVSATAPNFGGPSGTLPRFTIGSGQSPLMLYSGDSHGGSNSENRPRRPDLPIGATISRLDMQQDPSMRPRGYVEDSTGRVAAYPTLPSEPALTAPLTALEFKRWQLLLVLDRCPAGRSTGAI